MLMIGETTCRHPLSHYRNYGKIWLAAVRIGRGLPRVTHAHTRILPFFTLFFPSITAAGECVRANVLSLLLQHLKNEIQVYVHLLARLGCVTRVDRTRYGSMLIEQFLARLGIVEDYAAAVPDPPPQKVQQAARNLNRHDVARGFNDSHVKLGVERSLCRLIVAGRSVFELL